MLGRYRLLSLLATGGMGEVFLARQEGPAGFAKTVVVKRILRHLAQDQGFIDQFVAEARIAALLQHPNIAQVFGLEHEAQTWFMAMEYVHGRSLRAIIEECRKRGLKVPIRVAVRLCSQVLQGLHLAHELTDEQGKLLGILHRDVTPENILISFSGQAKLVDFGIAKAMANATLRQRPPWGKLPYMAPELIRQMPPPDRRADLYALGIVLYELLTLTKPPNVQSSVETLSVPTTPYTPQGALPASLDQILVKALALEPGDRYATGADLSQALESWLTATGQTVLPNDTERFLIDLFGVKASERHDSPAPSGHVGTQPLALGDSPATSSGNLVPFDDSQDPTLIVPEVKTETQTPVVIGLGILTALIFLGVTTAAILGARAQQAAPPKPAPVERPVVAVPDPAPEPPGPVLPPVDPPTPTPPVIEFVDAGTIDVDFDEDDPAPKSSPRKKRTGKVVFKLNPGFEVFLGNRSLGITPLKAMTLPTGTAHFTLKNVKSGAAKKVSVKVPAGGSVQLKPPR